MSYQDYIDANKQMSEDIDVLLRVVRAAKKVSKEDLENMGTIDYETVMDENLAALYEALEALPEHLKERD